MYTISDYLLDVLYYLNVKDILGVPGDYNLSFLDHITKRNDMKWRGNSNELNAAYMADGYARQNGFAAFVTTFGVGELSAINGITGSKVERVPVLEIVGSPSTQVQNNHKLMHHSLGDGTFNHFRKVHQDLGIKTGYLTKDNAVSTINDVIKYVIDNKRPAYLNFPSNLADMPLNPIFKKIIPQLFEDKSNSSNQVDNQTVINEIKNAKSPIIIVGEDIERFGLSSEVKKLIIDNQIPFADLIESKGTIDESLDQFIGTYNGKLSSPETNKLIENADLVLLLGTVIFDTNIGGFDQIFNNQNTIDINSSRIDFYSEIFTYYHENSFIKVIKEISKLKLENVNHKKIKFINKISQINSKDQLLTQNFYINAMQDFIKSGDTVVVDQGTSTFGLSLVKLPADVTFICQPSWSSIGYSFPATLGSELAAPKRRTVLSVGEGSLLLTIQEMAFAIKNNLKPIIFILDNRGYTVERVIHGMTEPYNDVPQLDYAVIPQAFGASKDQYEYFDVKTENELVAAMKKINLSEEKLTIVRVCLAKDDAPSNLKQLGETLSQQNK
ncbi:alpha-keto acid decarboxylase family protein [Fructilactobacillus lindneri]|uniref:Alpha-keto-acid decarboxylase n=1 Tax=Fructilactobacillus lindneri TaxID=53444 RepID=A0AB33BC67_9LACO|nr:thiamine pyrophosphate-binding protein [Fructilactobacillus lindneri]ANZ57676.1 hypothetical protein AYR60_02310 [Fructilactobacillus lindneri]ANZ58946.1 hypothetical protein AYR59_02310 [Fructilactobacillus lindneri]POG97971.1 hypothetical protein BGL31_04525 [Fructilactobacillus lindneri]POG99025.1 hypothetical protein BGL32_06240 [Fructilactobacillus lindneri]POH01517.1 hypothetical protein BGL33_05325 [Fructilactobacillus lindneri]